VARLLLRRGAQPVPGDVEGHGAPQPALGAT
jgi:hypothetical protein